MPISSETGEKPLFATVDLCQSRAHERTNNTVANTVGYTVPCRTPGGGVMAASTWKQQSPPRSCGVARPNIPDILSRVENKTPPIPAGVSALTAREQQILQLLAEGLAATTT